MTELEAETGGSRVRELDRIAAFTDGVIAIAITLLVLAIDVPNVKLEPGDSLDDKLLDLGPDLFAYALSFAVIGRYWLLHHRFFATLERFDSMLITLNLLFLGWIVLIPFTSDLLGEFPGHAASVIAYAVVLTAVGVVNWMTVRHAIRHGLTGPSPVEPFHGDLVGLSFPAIFALSIPVALLSPRAASLTWLLVFFVHPIMRRRRRED